MDMARGGALRLLAGVRDGLSLSDQAGALKALAPPDQARAARLAAEVLRHQSRADAVIGAYVSRRPSPQVADILRQRREDGLLVWAICEAASDRLIGSCVIFAIRDEQGCAEIGYSLHRNWQGRGLASEALRAVLRHPVRRHGPAPDRGRYRSAQHALATPA